MNKSENVFFRILDIFAHFVLLNVLWIILCIPVLTIFPATTALFSVVRKWVSEGTDAGVFHLFFTSFKENFKKSFTIGIMWTIAGSILYFDLALLLEIEFTGRYFLFILLIFSAIIYIFISIYLFFLLAHYDLSVLHTIKNALLLSVSNLYHTVLCLVIIGGASIIIYYFPVFIMIFGSVLAFILYNIFHKLLYKIQEKKELEN